MPPRQPKSLAIARKSLLAVAATEERRLRGMIESEWASAEDKERAAGELSTLVQQTVLTLASLEQATEREAEVASRGGRELSTALFLRRGDNVPENKKEHEGKQ